MPDAPRQADLPVGTVTFLFTDIEGSTRLLQDLGARYGPVLNEHRAIIGAAIEGHGGRVFGTEGDAVFAAFADATSAIAAAAEGQRSLAGNAWPDRIELKVRMGIHTGDAILTGGDYVGLALHQVARIAAAGHGGQVVVSQASRALAAPSLPADLELRDLGEHRLKDLARPERLYEVAGPGLGAGFPALRTRDARPNNLPLQLTSFVGRNEIAEARRLLGLTRHLTLTGPGGTGKTRLALQLAADVMDEFGDGVFFVALDAVVDPDVTASAIAAALGVDPGGRPPLERLVEHLRDRRLLLVLDNFEQIVEAAPLVSQLLRECPNLKIVVTSRVVLHASGEQEYPVPPLGLPRSAVRTAAEAAGSEAVRLFVERATASRPDFVLTDEEAPIVADIVTRLDGLPLAIELAAARVRILPVAVLRARLDQRLSSLTGGARDLPARQQTLRGAIDWSYDLLDEPDRRLFARFAVFAGGACLSQAEAVCGPADDLGRDVLDGLTSLSEKSLIRAMPASGPEPRFAMLATIREYAVERLEGGAGGEAPAEALRERHVETYLALVEGCAMELTGRHGNRWLDRLELDHDNIRAALDWAVANERVDLALRFLAATWRFWQIRGHLHEAHERRVAILALPRVDDQPPLLLARAYGAAGSISYWRDEADRSRFYRLALERARRSEDQPTIAEALYNIGFAPIEGEVTPDELSAAGRPFLEDALALYQRLGDVRGTANSHWALAVADLVGGDVPSARVHLAECLVGYEAIGDVFGAAWAHHLVGLTDLNDGQLDRAGAEFAVAMSLFNGTGDQSGIVLLLADFMLLARERGQTDRYWRLAGACSVLRIASGTDLVLQRFGTSSTTIDWRIPDRPDEDEEAIALWTEGETLPVEAAIAYAVAGAQPAAE